MLSPVEGTLLILMTSTVGAEAMQQMLYVPYLGLYLQCSLIPYDKHIDGREANKHT